MLFWGLLIRKNDGKELRLPNFLPAEVTELELVRCVLKGCRYAASTDPGTDLDLGGVPYPILTKTRSLFSDTPWCSQTYKEKGSKLVLGEQKDPLGSSGYSINQIHTDLNKCHTEENQYKKNNKEEQDDNRKESYKKYKKEYSLSKY